MGRIPVGSEMGIVRTIWLGKQNPVYCPPFAFFARFTTDMAYLPLEKIAERVREEMEERHLTQSEIAEHLEVSQPAVSAALNGKSKQRSLLFRLARKLGFTVGETAHYRFEARSNDTGN